VDVQQNKLETRENPKPMGRTRKDTPSRELVRLSWLIQQLDDLGMGQAAIAEMTGVKSSYLNQLRHYDRYRKTGFGTDTLRQIMSGLGLSPSYFFDDYPDQQDHRLHLLSAKRDEKRVAAIEQALQTSERERAAQAVELAHMKADLAAVRADLRQVVEALKGGPRKRTAR
jgi:transcriptional regulator with XRE-family HTH domain